MGSLLCAVEVREMSIKTASTGVWRRGLVERLSRVLSSEPERSDVDHVLEVERTVRDVLQEPEYAAGPTMDEVALIAAALLHEVGLVHRKHHWSDDGLEHLGEGVRLASEILHSNEAFDGRPARVEKVLSLVAHHDDTIHAFPSKRRGGAPILADSGSATEDSERELAVLREADARVHVGASEIAASIQVWRNQGVPYFAQHGPRLNSWMWHECVAGNMRLTGKRALIDAQTQAGRDYGVQAYDRLESLIRDECQREGVPYEQEISGPAVREASVARMEGRSFSLRIDAFQGWHSLEQELRSCTLREDSSIYPYQTAGLRSEMADINRLSPLALYVLENRVDEVLELHDALMVQYCFALWDLPGWMEFRYNSPNRQIIAPPLVEDYVENKAFPGPRSVAGLVDGLHRCMAARAIGAEKIRALVAADVHFPLVPLPAEWSDVQVVRKRNYRYNTLEEFLEECPDVSEWSDVRIDEENFRYFLYRDLSGLGSRGERTFREFDELRAGKA